MVDPGTSADAASSRPVGIGRPPILTPAPAGSPKGPFLPVSTGAVSSGTRPRLGRGERRLTLRHSVVEGMFAAAHAALSGNGAGGNVFTVGFALLLGASDPELGLLVALPQVATVFQAITAYALRRAAARRPLVVAACVVSRGSVALWPLLPVVCGGSALHVFLGLWAVASIAGSYGNNAWMSWMADLVPRAIRGRYFSIRNNLCNLVSLLLSVGAGVALDRYAGLAPHLDPAADARRFQGFAVVFGLAVLAGGVSTWLLRRQLEPERPPAPALVPFREFILGPVRDAGFRRLLLFYAFFWAVNGLANPFWTPFILEDLGRSYSLVTALGLLGGAMSFLALPVWGRLADRFGAKPVIAAAVLVSATHPLYYLLARPDFWYPLVCDAVSSGIVWGGFNLALFNLVLAAAPRGPGREIYYAAFNGAGGLAMATTSIAAGAVMSAVPAVTVFGHALLPRQVIFASVSVLRLAALALLAGVHEPGRRRAPAAPGGAAPAEAHATVAATDRV
jgi:MFS family permease